MKKDEEDQEKTMEKEKEKEKEKAKVIVKETHGFVWKALLASGPPPWDGGVLTIFSRSIMSISFTATTPKKNQIKNI